MFRRLKLLIKHRILGIRSGLVRRSFLMSQKKTNRLRDKYNTIHQDWLYAEERLYPEKTWEMRAEREFQRLNL